MFIRYFITEITVVSNNALHVLFTKGVEDLGWQHSPQYIYTDTPLMV